MPQKNPVGRLVMNVCNLSSGHFFTFSVLFMTERLFSLITLVGWHMHSQVLAHMYIIILYIPPLSLITYYIRVLRVHIHKHTPRPMVVYTARGSGSSIKGMFAERMWVLNCIKRNPSGLSLSSKAKQAVLQSHYTGEETQTCLCYIYPHASTKTKNKEGMWNKGLSKVTAGQSLVKDYGKYSFLMCTFSVVFSCRCLHNTIHLNLTVVRA